MPAPPARPRSQRKFGRHREGRFIALFALTLTLHVALPLLRDVELLSTILGAAFIAELGFAGWITLERPTPRKIYFGLLVVSVTTTALTVTLDHPAPTQVWLIYHVLLFAITTLLVIRWVIRRERVTSDTIFAALSGYYLLGFTWALLYASLAWLPHAFNTELAFDESFYFSFVTLTTLGFGDIAPTHPLTRALVTCEALLGQVYLVVLVARLVSLYTTHARDLDPDAAD